jgi:hypothetical protein
MSALFPFFNSGGEPGGSRGFTRSIKSFKFGMVIWIRATANGSVRTAAADAAKFLYIEHVAESVDHKPLEKKPVLTKSLSAEVSPPNRAALGALCDAHLPSLTIRAERRTRGLVKYPRL